jgi:hypothetical protein
VKGTANPEATKQEEQPKKEEVTPVSSVPQTEDTKPAEKPDQLPPTRQPPSETKHVSHKIITRSNQKRRGGPESIVNDEKSRAAGAAAKKDPLLNYQAPFRSKPVKKPEDKDEPKKDRKVYTLEFIFSYRPNNK